MTLWKYGTFSETNNKWTFYLWKDLTISDDSIIEMDNTSTPTKLKFTERSGYSFIFQSNGHTITYDNKEYNIDQKGTLTEKTNP